MACLLILLFHILGFLLIIELFVFWINLFLGMQIFCLMGNNKRVFFDDDVNIIICIFLLGRLLVLIKETMWEFIPIQ